jgi:hypothetical protein
MQFKTLIIVLVLAFGGMSCKKVGEPNGAKSSAEVRKASPPSNPPVKKRFEDMTALEVAQDPAAYGFEKGGSMVMTPTADGVREGVAPSRDEQWTKKTEDGRVYILTIHYDKDGKLVHAKWGGF